MAMLQQGRRRRTIHHNPRRMYICMYLPTYASIYLTNKDRRITSSSTATPQPHPATIAHLNRPLPHWVNLLTCTCCLTQKCHRHNSTPLHSVTLPMRKSRITLTPSKRRDLLPPRPLLATYPSHPTPKARNFCTRGGRHPQTKLLNPFTAPNRIESIPSPKQSVTAQDPDHQGSCTLAEGTHKEPPRERVRE